MLVLNHQSAFPEGQQKSCQQGTFSCPGHGLICQARQPVTCRAAGWFGWTPITWLLTVVPYLLIHQGGTGCTAPFVIPLQERVNCRTEGWGKHFVTFSVLLTETPQCPWGSWLEQPRVFSTWEPELYWGPARKRDEKDFCSLDLTDIFCSPSLWCSSQKICERDQLSCFTVHESYCGRVFFLPAVGCPVEHR